MTRLGGALASSSASTTTPVFARAFGASAFRRADDAQNAEMKLAFMNKFASLRTAPNMENPSTPTDFFKPRKEVPAGTKPDKVTLNFYLPHKIEMREVEVQEIIIPATTGDFGVLPGHVPTVAQMRPGVVTVTHSATEVSKYFVSSGFAFVHADSTTDIVVVEAVPVEQLDPVAVNKSLADFQAKLGNAKDDYEKASAQIGIDVCSAMNFALVK